MKSLSLGVLYILLAVFCGSLGQHSVAFAVEAPVAFESSTLSIRTGHESHAFRVEIARTDRQRARGLMFRRSLPRESGMLFLFDSSQMVTMWMKNTFIPLDIIFINDKGVIVHIAKSTVPHSLDYIPSKAPVVSVLEVNAGIAERLDIQVGDRVEHAFFRSREAVENID